MATILSAAWVQVLAIWGASQLDECFIALTKDTFVPDVDLDLAALEAIEADFPGYARVELGEFATAWTAPAWQTAEGYARTVSEELATFLRNAGGDAQSVFGWFIVNAAGVNVIAAGLFAEAVPVDGDGEGISVLPVITVPSQADLSYQEI